jgi:hypothetical protein
MRDAMKPVTYDEMAKYFTAHVVKALGEDSDWNVLVLPSFYDYLGKEQPGSDLGSDLVTWKTGPLLEGRYRVVGIYDPFWDVAESPEAARGEGKSYFGEVIVGPTWEDLMVEAERMSRCLRDNHHKYLEGFQTTASPIEQLASVHEEGALDIQLLMGS